MVREGPTQEIKASPGVVEIELPEDPTTGYLWQLRAGGDDVREVGREFRSAPGELLAGGAGTRVFRLELAKSGTYRLEFLLQRPWQGQALERRVVTVEVG